MKKKIFKYLSIAMATILAAAMAVMIGVLNTHFISIEEDRLISEAHLAGQGVEVSGAEYLENLNPEGFRVTWISPSGVVKYDSQADPASMENHSSREEVKEAFAEGSGSAVRYSSTMAVKTLYVAVKLEDGSVVRIAEDYDSVGILTLRMLSPILLIFLAGIVISFAVAGILAKKIAEPINAIDLDRPCESEAYEEIRPLLSRIRVQNDQISEQVNTLHQKKKEFESVTNNISEGLILLNQKGEILSLNHCASRLLSIEADVRSLDGISEGKLMPVVEDALNGISQETILHVNDNIIRVTGHTIRSHNKITGASILAYDISEEYEAELSRREFTANVSHELKTPLQSIMGSAELLEHHLVRDADKDEFFHNIYSESSRMLALIDDIIRLSQLDENKEIDSAVIDLVDPAKEAEQGLTAAIEEKGITFRMDLQSVKVNANYRLLYEIFYNLMDNAIRYNKENGTVTVKTFRDGDTAYIQVSDTGIGIPRTAINHIFERFYRVDKSHSRKTGGTGLGLSIVKHAVSISHGKIEVDSKVDCGTTFTVSFDAVDKEG